jgi:hypothetical protein
MFLPLFLRQTVAAAALLDLSQAAECVLAESIDVETLVTEAVAACATAMELRAALAEVLATLTPLYGCGHAAVDAAFRLLAASADYQLDQRPSWSAQEGPGYPLVAHIVATPALSLAPERLLFMNDTSDLERGVLLLAETTLAQAPHLLARFPYLPVQAIPQGSCTPDLIVEFWDGVEQLTTLHFCTIWRGMQSRVDPTSWQRISYPRPQLAMIYNQQRLALCPYCLHLHRSTCLLPVPLATGDKLAHVSP